MKALITHQFNSAMAGLTPAQQREVSQIFSWVNAIRKEDLLDSTWLTKIDSQGDGIYTLRGKTVRIFCTFDGEDNIIFVDVTRATGPSLPTEDSEPTELTLFATDGTPKVYVARDDDNTIYSFKGKPLAYIDDDSNVYGFNGSHLGWFEDGILWNHQGQRVGFTNSTCPVFTKFEPFKGFKQFKPFKAFKQFAPFKPFKGHSNSPQDVETFLEQGR